MKKIISKKRIDDSIIYELTEELTNSQQKKIFKYYMKNIELYYNQSEDFLSSNYSYYNILKSIKYLNIYDDSIIENYIETLQKKKKFHYLKRKFGPALKI